MKSFSVVSLLVLVCLLCNCGCGSSTDSSGGIGCTANIVDGIVVKVYDARTHVPIAGSAVGKLRDGSYTETLRPFSFDASGTAISLSGAAERAGTYTVRIEKPGYTPFERQNVVVTRGICHVDVTTLTADLQPIP